MNEKIKELAAQAGVLTDWGDDITVGRWGISGNYERMQEFAELIVRECLAHGKLAQSQAVVNGSEEYNAGREMGIEVFMNQIKKHFGVEE